MGILVKDSLFSTYTIKVIDKSFQDILAIELKHIFTDHIIVVYSCYLPPDGSPWSNCTEFFGHLMSQLYINNDADAIFICGDLNARCGNGIDTLLDDSDIPERHVMDTCTVNLYGEKLIDFVRDMTLCIVNGRVSPEKDNYTSISNRGRSVVDYILTQQHFLSNCNDFAVHTVTDLIEQFNLQHYVSSSSKPPDHSVLWINLLLPGYSQRVDEPVRRDQPPDHLSQNNTDNINSRHFTKFMYNGDKHELMNNNSWLSKTQEILDHIKILETQCDVDKMYDNLCTHIFSELDIFYKKIDSRRSVRRRHKHSKPYWDNELGHLWKCMREKEKCYLKCTGSNRAKLNLHKEFKLSRYNFDKSLRQKERIYNRNKIAEIDHFKGNNPTEFWKLVNNLVPKRNKNIPCKVRKGDTFVTEPSEVLDVWASEFSSLYNNPSEVNGDIDVEFRDRCKEHVSRIECEMKQSNDSIYFLNEKIGFHEVEKAIKGLKNNKACGIDGIPNYVLKEPAFLTLLWAIVAKTRCRTIHMATGGNHADI